MRRFSIFGGIHRAILALFAAALISTAGFAQQHNAAANNPCDLQVIGAATVSAVQDGRTFRTADGREVRLAGIEVPPPDSPAGIAARAALIARIAGKSLTLKRLGTGEDRYGRVLAFAFGEDGSSIQHAMLASGWAFAAARVGPSVGLSACAAEFFAAEKPARENQRGLWADAAFKPKSAENPDEILADKGRFALVEGKILSVRESGATIYMNFSRRWSQGFSVTILKRHQRAFAAAGIEPKRLEGQRIRVRGVIEQRSGPSLEASRPEQIEVVN
jgi:endonuclease YncB( thermonuclease family)